MLIFTLSLWVTINTITICLCYIGLFLGYTVLQAASIFLSMLNSVLKSIFGCKDDKIATVQDKGRMCGLSYHKLQENIKAIHYKIEVQETNLRQLKKVVTSLNEKET